MPTLKQVNDIIATQVSGLVGVGQPLASSYSYPEANPASYPTSTIHLSSGADIARLTTKKETQLTFFVHVIVLDSDTETNYNQLLEALETVIASLRSDNMWNDLGSCTIRTSIQGWTIQWTELAESKVIDAAIEFKVDVLTTTV